ncbi:DNA repair protein rhp7-like [Vicia villosa]|uniref:DNA repair protein rhp7-like n=1 Tax=Vicia villosa TaxID=3911 RepID=UPI00273B4AEE|nr:DNA repair protein rhp7-like [Vicia villosa]
MAPPAKTTPKPSQPNHIHPLTPSQSTESPPISSSVPPRRRSLRLAGISISEPPQSPADSTPKPSARVSKSKTPTASESQPNQTGTSSVNLRSGTKSLKRGIAIANEDKDDSENNATKKNKIYDEGESSNRGILTEEEKGKETVVIDENDESSDEDDDSSDEESEIENTTEEKNDESNVIEQSRNPMNNSREARGYRRNLRNLERFRNIARENASRFALFADDEDNVNDLSPENEQERNEIEIEDWPGPFSTAMKIIRDREKKGIQFQAGSAPIQKDLIDSIKWTSKRIGGKLDGKVSVPSLQELCIRILAKNVDAVVSLESVPDDLRHRLSQLLCDSRRINDHFFGLLVGGAPTEIRLRNCSWLSEDHFTKCFQASDTSNLVVLQLDLCGRCLPDYVVVATLARSPKQLPNLTSLSLRGACRLSDGGLRTLVSSTPTLRSINLSMCSLLTSASLYILAETLKSLLKELYLDHCIGIDAALIVPALVEFEHLEVLSLAGIPTVCDTFVKDYIVARGHNMKELILKDCINLTDASIKVIAEYCPGICELDLSNVCKLTDLSMGYLTNGCRALHTLKLCRNSFSDEAVAAFVETNGESLKELSLNNVKKVGYHTTLSLASHAKKLHSLDLSWCRNLTDNALGLIADSCTALRLLKLFGCTQVTDVFLKGHSNSQMQIIGIKMTSVLQHVKVPDPHRAALNYSSVSVDLAA